MPPSATRSPTCRRPRAGSWPSATASSGVSPTSCSAISSTRSSASPAGSRARERLTRGWDAAVGQPRYGPATAAIDDLIERLRGPHAGGRAGPRRDVERRTPRSIRPGQRDLARGGRGPARVDRAGVEGCRPGAGGCAGQRDARRAERPSSRGPRRPPDGAAPRVSGNVIRAPRGTVAWRLDRASPVGRPFAKPRGPGCRELSTEADKATHRGERNRPCTAPRKASSLCAMLAPWPPSTSSPSSSRSAR